MSRKEKRDSISRHLEDVSLSIHIYMYPLYPRAPPQDDISRGTIHPFSWFGIACLNVVQSSLITNQRRINSRVVIQLVDPLF